MTVDLDKMLTTTDDFQTDQLKKFTEFMETSKGVVASLGSVEKKTAQGVSQIQAALSTFLHAKKGTDSLPILALQYDKAYIEVMAKVVLEFDGYQDPTSFCDYIDVRSKQITLAMKKGKVSHE
ncbi:hypothetical protein [uncultured Shewanella sp.]|uniref:hypothetical protein n=1 Tax=uncultured Shewanella sp. TaxID=173975 RepID=UPI002622E1ED|nr:hypothetical protein [uncultured Shewanella sp.]